MALFQLTQFSIHLLCDSASGTFPSEFSLNGQGGCEPCVNLHMSGPILEFCGQGRTPYCLVSGYYLIFSLRKEK